jgi:hypothetical protein
MPATISIPAIGPVRKEIVYAAGAGIVGVVGYAWFKAGAGGGGGKEAIQQVVPASEILPVTDYQNPQGYGNSSGVFPGNVDPNAITSNSEWTQQAIEYLVSIGYNATFVSTTLGKFLGRQPLNAIEKDLVRTALAAMGPPPEGGPYPVGVDAPPTATLPAPATTAPPPRPSGLKILLRMGDWILLDWSASDRAEYYTVHEQSAIGQSSQTTRETRYWVRGLAPGMAHTFTVRAVRGDQQSEAATTVGSTEGATGGHPYENTEYQNAAPEGSGTGVSQQPVTNLRITGVSRSSINLDWDAPEGAETFLISEQSSKGSSSQTSVGSSFTKSGLLSNLPHTFTVFANGPNGRSPGVAVSANTAP